MRKVITGNSTSEKSYFVLVGAKMSTKSSRRVSREREREREWIAELGKEGQLEV